MVMARYGMFQFSKVAEGEGFEPSVRSRTTVFETVPFDHSGNPPSIGHLHNQIYAIGTSGDQSKTGLKN